MNDKPKDAAAASGDHSSAEDQHQGRAPISLKRAILRGAEEARREVEEGVPRMRAAATQAVYWMAYGLTFAGIFGWTLAKNLAPEVVNSGCRDGMKAGQDAANKWTTEMRKRNTPQEPALLPAPVVGSAGTIGTT